MLYTLLLTSLLGKIRAGANDDDEVSSTALDDICDEELLNTDGFNIADCIWILFFLSNGLRGGKTGGISWLVDCVVDPAGRLYCFWDDNEDFVGNKNVFGDGRDSSSNATLDSAVDVPGLLWPELRPGFRLDENKKKFIMTNKTWQFLSKEKISHTKKWIIECGKKKQSFFKKKKGF